MNWRFWTKQPKKSWEQEYVWVREGFMEYYIRFEGPGEDGPYYVTSLSKDMLTEMARRWNSHKDAPRLDGT